MDARTSWTSGSPRSGPTWPCPGPTALWPSERGERIGLQRINSRFAAYRDALGFDAGLDFHGLRSSYVTHLIEAGRDPLFVQIRVSVRLLSPGTRDCVVPGQEQSLRAG